MRTQYPKLSVEEYQNIAQLADKRSIEDLETLIKGIKKEHYHDYKGNTGLIQTLERAIDVKKARKSREDFKTGVAGLSDVYWSAFEEIDEAEEAAYLNLVDSSHNV